MSENQIKIFHDFRKEFSVDENGSGYASRKVTAKLANVSRQAIQQLLNKISTSEQCKQTLPKMLQPFARIDLRGGKPLPDLLVSAIVKHYAYQGNEIAQQYDMAFSGAGLRSVIQQVKGWQPPSQKYAGYILKEPRQWTKMFGDDFYDELSRLTGLSWDKKTHQKPCVFAQHTYDLVYFHLPNEVYESIKQSQKEHGGYIHRMHEFLSPKGLDALKSHLVLTMNILTASSSLSQAKQLVSQSLTRNYQLGLFDE